MSPELLTQELHAALDAVNDRAGAKPYSDTVTLWNPKLAADFDVATAAAHAATAEGHFREAVRQIRAAESLFVTIGELLDAAAAAERAEAAADDVYALAGVARLRSLPAVASLGQIIERARQWIVEERYRESLHLTRLDGRMAASLLERRDAGDADRETFEAKLADVDELAGATAPFVDAPDEDLTRDGTTDTLRSLFEQRYVRLGLRLLTELQIQLAGRYRFRRQFERAPFGSAAEVRELVRMRGWDGAADYEWQRSIERYAGVLQKQIKRLNGITEESWKI